MEEHTALLDAYLKLKKRWWKCLWTFLLAILASVIALTKLTNLTVPLVPILEIVLFVYAFLCYAAQFFLLHEMAKRMHLPRVGNHELGFWYTVMLLALLTTVPGMIAEVGLFLLYARKFVSHANAAQLENPGQA